MHVSPISDGQYLNHYIYTILANRANHTDHTNYTDCTHPSHNTDYSRHTMV